MKRIASILIPALVLFGASVSSSLWLASFRSLPSLNISSHSFRADILFMLTAFTGFLLFFYIIWRALSLNEIKLTKQKPYSVFRKNLILFCPFLFFLLTPLLHKFYLDRQDLNLRLAFLFFVVLTGFISLNFIHSGVIFNRVTISSWKEKWKNLSKKKKILILFLTAFLIYNLATAFLVSRGLSFSGDEPYYLLTSHSLLQDQDINLANNYADQDYFHFYSREKQPNFRLGMYARAGKQGRDYIYPINLFGVSILVLPWYWLSQFFSGGILTFIIKSSLSLWGALLGVQIYLFAKEKWERERLALILWFFYAFSSPLLFYSIHVYPEVPIALFSIFIFRKINSPQKPSLKLLLFTGFLLGLFPWFGLKYNLILLCLLFICLYELIKKHNLGIKAGAFLFFPFISITGFFIFIYSLYGSFSPISIYEGVISPEKANALREAVLGYPLRWRLESFLDYFLDQRDGLLLYSPFFFFSLLGLIEAWKKARKELLGLLFISLPFLLNYAFFTHRQGYSPQGRVLAPFSWVGVLLVGYFLFWNRKKAFTFLFWFLSLSGVVVSLILLLQPGFLYQPTTHEHTSRAGDLFVFLSNTHFFLPTFLPSFIKIGNSGYWPNYIWLLGILGILTAYSLIKGRLTLEKSHLSAFCLFILCGACFLWVIYPQQALYPSHVVRYSPQKELGFYLFPLRKDVVVKKEAEFYLHKDRSYRFLFASNRELEKILINFGSLEGIYQAEIYFFDLPVFEGKTNEEIEELVIRPEHYYKKGNLFLYEIKLKLNQKSNESMLRFPYFIKIFPY